MRVALGCGACVGGERRRRGEGKEAECGDTSGGKFVDAVEEAVEELMWTREGRPKGRV